MANNELIAVPTGAAAGDVARFDGTRWQLFDERNLAWPKGHIDSLPIRYSSATAIIVGTGKARSSDDTKNLTLADESTVSITTIGAALGLDRVTATATCDPDGTETVVLSASLYSETALSGTVRTLTGTVSTVGTAATGTGTKFLTEVAIGDVIRSATKGASRVTAIASDTALTLVAATPGGNATAETFTFYENLILTMHTTTERVNTVTHNGLTVVMAGPVPTASAGQVVWIGPEIGSAWYFVWAIEKDDASAVTAILSTQRTRPYGVTNYAGGNARRLLGWVPNNSSSNFIKGRYHRRGRSLSFIYDNVEGATRILSAGRATSFTRVDASGYIPPTANEVILQVIGNSVDVATDILVRELGSSATFGQDPVNISDVNGGVNGARTNVPAMPMNSGQAVEYYLTATVTTGGAFIDVVGFRGET